MRVSEEELEAAEKSCEDPDDTTVSGMAMRATHKFTRVWAEIMKERSEPIEVTELFQAQAAFASACVGVIVGLNLTDGRLHEKGVDHNELYRVQDGCLEEFIFPLIRAAIRGYRKQALKRAELGDPGMKDVSVLLREMGYDQ